MKRVSPDVLLLLHKATGKLYCDYYISLNPFDRSPFAVHWAGESESKNWMHIAREYTEKWLPQQQIRDAVGKPGLMTKELFLPFIDIFMLALPYSYRDTVAEEGTGVSVIIQGSVGGSWTVARRNGSWQLNADSKIVSEVFIPQTSPGNCFRKVCATLMLLIRSQLPAILSYASLR